MLPQNIVFRLPGTKFILLGDRGACRGAPPYFLILPFYVLEVGSGIGFVPCEVKIENFSGKCEKLQ